MGILFYLNGENFLLRILFARIYTQRFTQASILACFRICALIYVPGGTGLLRSILACQTDTLNEDKWERWERKCLVYLEGFSNNIFDAACCLHNNHNNICRATLCVTPVSILHYRPFRLHLGPRSLPPSVFQSPYTRRKNKIRELQIAWSFLQIVVQGKIRSPAGNDAACE